MDKKEQSSLPEQKKMPSRFLGMLGLAAKAGKVVSGEFQVDEAVKSYKAELVIVSEDASERTKKTIRNHCEFREIPLVCYADKVTLGNAIGRQYRSLVAVTDPGFAKQLLKHLEAEKKQ